VLRSKGKKMEEQQKNEVVFLQKKTLVACEQVDRPKDAKDGNSTPEEKV
jgi:hypothetical protein